MFEGKDTPNEVTSNLGRDTCMASRAAGNTFGAAKASTLVVTKLPDFSDGALAGLLPPIIEHIIRHGRQGRSVVLLGFTSESTYPSGFPWDSFRGDLLALERLNVVVVCAAGDNRQDIRRLVSDTAPATLSDSLLVVSSCTSKGYRSSFSQMPLGNALFAPGDAVRYHSTGMQTTLGTSFCESVPNRSTTLTFSLQLLL